MSDAEKLILSLQQSLDRERYLLKGYSEMFEALSVIALDQKTVNPRLLAQECIEVVTSIPVPDHANLHLPR